MENDNKWKEVRGLAYKDNNEIKFTGYIDFVENLSKIPFPKRIEESIIDSKSISIISSRGCPFSCKFCAAGKLSGNKYRLRNICDVINEIEFLVNKYRINLILFADDTITLFPKRVYELCNKISEKS